MFEQSESFLELRRSIRDDPTSCLLLAGAGLTMACRSTWRFPDEGPDPASWFGLIAFGIGMLRQSGATFAADGLSAELDRANKEEDQGKRGKAFADVGQGLWQALDERELVSAWLERSIGRLEISENGQILLSRIKRLHEAGVSIVTTNYEDFLARVLKVEAVTHHEQQAMAGVFAGTSNENVCHIHGHWSRPETIVFTSAHYAALTPRGGDVEFAERASLTHRNWIFVGCGAGLTDSNFGDLMQWIVGYLDQEAQRDSYFIGTNDEWKTISSIPAVKKMRIRHIALDCHERLDDLLAELCGAISTEPFVSFGPDCPGVLERLSAVDEDARSLGELRPTWNELNQVRLVPRAANFRQMAMRLLRDRLLMIEDDAGTGKSVTGLQLAILAQRRRKDVFWWELSQDSDVAPAVMKRLQRRSCLLIVDEAHIDRSKLLKLVQAVLEPGSKAHLLVLATKTKDLELPGSLTRTAFVKRLEADFPTIPGFISIAIDNDFRKQHARYLLQRMGKDELADEIADLQCEQWKVAFKRQTLLFSAAFLMSEPLICAGFDWQIDPGNAIYWLRERFDLDRQTSRQKANLGYLAWIAKQADQSYGRVPDFALPEPSELPNRRAANLLVRYDNPTFLQPPLRLIQPDVFGQLVLQSLSEEAEAQAAAHNLTLPAKAARLLTAPESIGRLIASGMLDQDQLRAIVSDYHNHFTRRFSHLPLSVVNTFLTFLTEHDPGLAKIFGQRVLTKVLAEGSLSKRGSLDGAGSLVFNLFKAGRLTERPTESEFRPLSDALVKAVVERASPDRDFLNRNYNFYNLAQLLGNVPADQAGLGEFMARVWTPEWIDQNFVESVAEKDHLGELIYKGGTSSHAAIAAVLRQPDLGRVYEHIVAVSLRFRRRPDRYFSAFQILGPIYLFGTGSSDVEILQHESVLRWCSAVDQSELAKDIALAELRWCGQRAEPTVQRYQIKGWLGLRTYLELTGRHLDIGRSILVRQLEKWRARQAAWHDPSGERSPTTLVCDDMIRWFERSLEHSQPGGRVRISSADRGLRSLRDGIWHLPCRQNLAN